MSKFDFEISNVARIAVSKFRKILTVKEETYQTPLVVRCVSVIHASRFVEISISKRTYIEVLVELGLHIGHTVVLMSFILHCNN